MNVTTKIITGFVFSTLMTLILQSCSTANKPMAEMPVLDGTWELTYIAGSEKTIQEFYPDKIPTVIFDTPEKRISGNTGCNQYSGALKIAGSKINLTAPIAATKMMCMNSAAGETQFLQMLPKVNNYTVADGELSFRMGNETLMKFNKKM